MTEGPYKLPAGWRWVRLGEVFDLQQGASMSPNRRVGRNLRPFLRTKNILWGSVDVSSVDEMDFTEEEVEKLCLQPGDLLVCEGGDVGRTAIWEGQLPLALYQNHIHRLRRKNDDTEPRFFMYWMLAAYHVFRAYEGAESRTAIPNLSGRRLKTFLVPLPPLEEQRRIVARLEELMARVREAKRLRQQAREDAERLMQAALAEVFPRPGTKPPTGWRWVRLGEVAWRESVTLKPSDHPDAAFWYLGMENLEPGQWEEPYPVEVRGREIKSQVVAFRPGLVLYGKLRPYLNKVVVPSLEGVACTEFVPIATREDILSPQYLGAFLRSPSFVAYATQNTTGSRQPRTRVESLWNALLPLPPLDEQRRIVAHLEALQERVKALKESQAASDAELQRLEHAILDKAFRGEL